MRGLRFSFPGNMRGFLAGMFSLAATLLIGCGGGGGGSASRSFDQELQLTLRAGRGELTEAEKKRLLRENHPILAQVGEPRAFRLVEMFSRLPESERQLLLEESYVKWRMAELDLESQAVCRELIQLVMRMRLGESSPFEQSGTAEIQRALVEQTEVGFAVVELQDSRQRVVSWFAFGPKLATPLWVTIVNPGAAETPGYVHSHLQRLPLLKSLKSNSPPRLHVRPPLGTSLV